VPPEIEVEATDQALLIAWVGRADQDAFSALVQRHHGVVLAACRRRLGGTDAEDAAQAVFLVLARRGSELVHDPRPLAGWLYTVAGQVARNAERARGRRHHHEREAAMAAEQTTSDTGKVWDEASVHLDACLDRLPPQEREVLVLHYLAGKDRLACADELDITLDALKKRLGRGLERLRDLLRQKGVAVGSTAALTLVLEQHAVAAESTAAQVAAVSHPTPAATALSSGVGAVMTGFGLGALTWGVGLVLAAVALLIGGFWRGDPAILPPPQAATTAPLRWDDAGRPAFWFVTLTDWTFVPDPGVEPGLVPTRAVEVALVEAAFQPDDGLAMRMVAGWHGDDSSPGRILSGSLEITRRFEVDDGYAGLEMRQTLQDQTSPLVPARTAERVMASRRDGAVLPQEQPPATWAMRLERCGLPALAWPLPEGRLPAGASAALAGGFITTWSSPPDGDAARGQAEEGCPLLTYTCDHWERRGDNVMILNGTVFEIPVQASVSGTAAGTVAVRLRWDGRVGAAPGVGLPGWASVHADLGLTVDLDLQKPATGVSHRITGRVKLQRHAWRLDGLPAPTGDWLPVAPRLWSAVSKAGARIDAVSRPWQALADGADPTLARVARGVLHTADQPPQITPIAKPAGDF
jgi:RNA polymerase sigma-70 factor (ECF subfamily)